MRALALWSVVLAASSVGCIKNDNGAVLFHLDDPSPDFFGPPTYSSSEAAVVFSPDGPVFFGASSSQGEVHVILPTPLEMGTTSALPDGVEGGVTFAFGNATWSSQGGSVFVISLNPAIIRLIEVPMAASAGVAAGTFVFNGDGTFR